MAELVYNEYHMNKIVNRYRVCADAAQEIVNKLNMACAVVENNYVGQGLDITLDVFSKLVEHLDYLKVCCENTAEYVSFSLSSMQEQDRELSSGYGGSGH